MGRAGQAYDLAISEARAANFTGLISLRYVPASRATLAFTYHAPHTCIVDLDAPNSSQTQKVYKRIWKAFNTAGIPCTLHWGKMNAMDAAQVVRDYGQARVDSWKAVRRALLPTVALRKTFANEFLTKVGLAD